LKRGKLNLDDDITKYLPELPYKGVSVKNLLSNTGGIPEYRPLFAQKWNPSEVAHNKDVLAMFADQKPDLLFTPGSEFRYSNTGFVFLALIIEKVSGKNYEDYMRDEVFMPMDMRSTLIFTRDKQYNIENFAFPSLRVTLVNPVFVKPETVPALNFLNYLDGVMGDVSTASTVSDLYKMDRALMKGKFLSSSILQQAFTPFIMTGTAAARESEGYGLGWFTSVNNKGEKIVLHEGGMPGISTLNYINLDAERVIIILSNTNTTNSLEIGLNLARIYDREEIIEPKMSLAVEAARFIETESHEEALNYSLKESKTGNYNINEAEINSVGYYFFQEGNLDAALEIFKLNVELFPGSWNVFDSLAEGYLSKGEKDLAIKYYKKSIELNPENENGKNILKELEK
jgi:CubicO group peptidase (beta-lactamase class C family)